MKNKYSILIIIIFIGIGAVIFLNKNIQHKEIIHSVYVQEAVNIIRDKYGVPHIYADNMKDLFIGWGYAAAEDRLWQMEFFRRKIQGKQAEIYGSSMKESDFFRRRLGLERYAAMDEALLQTEIKNLLEAYTQGVNMLLQDKDKRSPQFNKLGYEPEPWTVRDILCLEKYVAWNFNDGGDTNMTNFIKKYSKDFHSKNNAEKFKEIFLFNYNHAMQTYNKQVNNDHAYHRMFHDMVLSGSNCWAVSGEKTKKGKPLLANDPHTSLLVPQYWHEVHLAIPRNNFHLAGVSLPGGCIIYIGRSLNVAWGLTKSYIDCVDFVEEKVSLEKQKKYWDGTKWKLFQVHEGTIKIKDGKEEKYSFLENKNGIQLFLDQSTTTVTMFQWTGLGPSEGTQSFIKGYTAKSVNNFISCLKPLKTPILNMHIADDAGNIGYQVMGQIPQHTFYQGAALISGWKGENAWNNYLSFNLNPHQINPENNFIATANNRMVDDQYPYYLYNEWCPNYRYDRIAEYMKQHEKVSLSDMMSLQYDVYEIRAREMVPLILEACAGKVLDVPQIRALTILKQWDYTYRTALAAPVIFEIWYKNFSQCIFKNVFDKNIYDSLLKNNYRFGSILREIAKKRYSAWFSNDIQKAKTKFQDIVFSAFAQTVQTLTEKDKNNFNHISWGQFSLRGLVEGSTLEQKKSSLIPPFAAIGGPETLNRGGYNLEKKPIASGASYRMIVDFADSRVLLYSCLIPGESEDQESSHYADQVILWKKGKYKKVFKEIKDITKNNYSLVSIIPGNEVHHAR